MTAVWSEPGHALEIVGPTLVQLWETATPTPVHMLRIRKQLEGMRPKYEKVYLFAVVSEHSAMPDSETRAVAARLSEVFDYYVGVHEGGSFRSAMVRTVLAGMSLMSSVRRNFGVCATVEEGVKHLATQAANTVDEAQLLRAISALRATLRKT